MIICECPNCDDPFNGGECQKGFCAQCLVELYWEATWGDVCDDCKKTLEKRK